MTRTVSVYAGTRLMAEYTRHEFKYAWRAALRRVRREAYQAVVENGATRSAPEFSVSASASRGRAVRFQVGNFAALPARRTRRPE